MLCFDPSSINEGGGGLVVEDGFSQTQNPNFSPNFSMSDHQSFHQNSSLSQPPHVEDGLAAALSMEYQQKLNLEMEQCYNCISNPNSNQISTHLMQEMPNQVLSCVESNWEDMNLCTHQQQQDQDQQHIMQIDIQNMQSNPYPPTHDLLNMLPFQRTSPSSLLPNSSSLSFEGGSSSGTHNKGSSFLTSLGLLGDHHLPSDHRGGVSFDPLLPVSLPPQQPPLLRELMQNYNSRNHGSLFSGVVHDERSDGFFQENDQINGRGYENGVFEFSAHMNGIGKGREPKGGKHYTTERQRRVQLNGKFEDLRKLVPNPSKNDKASVLKDAIDYINELKMRVAELKILVSKKRSTKERLKRQNVEDSSCSNNNTSGVVKTEDHHHDVMDGSSASALRSSWIHRKSKNTEIDVRIIDDDVTVKLVQQKKINCLMFVSKVLDELQLDLHHVAGGLLGDYYSFLLNSKISEGSTVHTQAIANRLIEVVDKQYAAVQPTGSF